MPKEGGVDISHIQDCLTALSAIVRLSAEERARLADREGKSIMSVMSGMVAMSLVAMDADNGLDVQQQGELRTTDRPNSQPHDVPFSPWSLSHLSWRSRPYKTF